MDIRLRELERRYASGDITAFPELQSVWKRLQLIPTDEHLLQMRCGYAFGGIDALPIVIDLWQHVFTQLAHSYHLHRVERLTHIPDLVDNLTGQQAFKSALLEYEDELNWQLENIQRISVPRFTSGADPTLELYRRFLPVAQLSNPYIEDVLGHPPIYCRDNEITSSNTFVIAYLNPRETDDEPWNIHREPVKLHTMITRLGGEWQVHLSWNIGDDFNMTTGEYDVEHTMDTICLPFFKELPCYLQEAPVWHTWGWGECSQAREFGNWSYSPLTDRLEDTHQLYSRADH